jgi:hypothetical protein
MDDTTPVGKSASRPSGSQVSDTKQARLTWVYVLDVLAREVFKTGNRDDRNKAKEDHGESSRAVG